MISVTRFDGSEFIINSDLIEIIEATPDTVITFARDKRVVVRETPDDIVAKIVSFRRRIYLDPSALVSSPDDRPTREQTSHAHKGTGAQRLHVVPQNNPQQQP